MSPAVTPRRTRLVRAPDLPRFQHALAVAALDQSTRLARDTAVLVPTLAAADELRQTCEDLCLIEAWQPSAADLAAVGAVDWPASGAFVLPHLVTRARLYDLLAARLGTGSAGLKPRPTFDEELVSSGMVSDRPPLDRPPLDRLGREVLFERAAARAIAAGAAPPFDVRPALLAEMQAFYDALGRHRRGIDDFERLVGGPLEAGAAIDRGARRLLEQTKFFAATFREYEAMLAERGELDEHRLRARLIEQLAARPLRRLIVSVADQDASSGGLFPADYDLLTRLPGLEVITVVATEALLGAGYLARILERLPEIDVHTLAPGSHPAPTLAAPAGDERLYFVSRDREQELADFARRRRLAADAGAAAFVYQRPLPYLALARQVLDAHGVAWQAEDAQPLAAEPYAAALDLVLTCVATEFARGPSLALLEAPQFRLVPEVAAEDGGSNAGTPHPGETAPLDRGDLAACDRELRDAWFFGGRDRLLEIRLRWQQALAAPDGVAVPEGRARGDRAARARRRLRSALRVVDVILGVADRLSPLEAKAPPSAHLTVLEAFLRDVDAPPPEGPARERWLRARGAVLAMVQGLRASFLRFGESPRPFADLAALLRRLLEEHTFNPRLGPGDVHLVDAEAAPYGRFTHVTLAGVVEGEWPSGGSRGIFYPASLLRELGWPAEGDRRAASRAAFDDLLRLPSRSVEISTFSLDDEAIVRAAPFSEDLDRTGLVVERGVANAEVAASVPSRLLDLTPLPLFDRDELLQWRALRSSRSDIALAAFHGAAGPVAARVYSVTSVDRYRQCPFKYFAADVLGLEEEPDDRPGLTVQERGQFVHEVFRDFFERWERAGGGAIDATCLDAARALFAIVVDAHLQTLPESERALERTRLMGSIAGAGLGERTFRFEAARTAAIVERLLEFPLDGAYELGDRTVRLRGTADRIDLLADGTLRLLDYKTGKASSARDALQIPVYALCAEQRLSGHRGRTWQVSEAGYLAFGRAEPFIAIVSGDDREATIDEAAEALGETTAHIESGAFPVAPEEPHLCKYCGFAAVCRKDYVEEV
jgi:RecB family exonuclease